MRVVELRGGVARVQATVETTLAAVPTALSTESTRPERLSLTLSWQLHL
jgi:hypothetical protein